MCRALSRQDLRWYRAGDWVALSVLLGVCHSRICCWGLGTQGETASLTTTPGLCNPILKSRPAVVAESDAAGVDPSQEDGPVSGFPAVSGQGAPAKSGKSWGLSLVTVLRSHGWEGCWGWRKGCTASDLGSLDP